MSLCLASGALLVALGASEAMLAWTHSVERVEWRETWRAEADHLVLVTAAVEGTGAGMEPPAEARRDGKAWVWHPSLRQAEVVLARSTAAADWRVCVGGAPCRSLTELLGAPRDTPARLIPCVADRR